MIKLFSSATKIVFIAVAFGFIGLTFIGLIEPKDFMVVAIMVFSFYYGKERKNDEDLSQIGQ